MPRLFSLKTAIRLAQLVVGGVFVFSGFVKCIDPMGTAIKLTEYFNLFGLTWLVSWTTALSVILALVEFFIGFNILFGRNRRFFLPLCGLFLLVFTPLTLYLAVANPISDCGCFGDAVVLSNWATFFKNVVLCLCLALLYWKSDAMSRLALGKSAFTFYFYYTFLLCDILCWLGISRLPLLDFRPFKSGINIVQAMGSGSEAWEETYSIIYEKEGERREFSLEALPDADSGWEFVEQKVSRLPKAGAASASESLAQEPTIKDFFLIDKDGREITDEILADTSYQFWLISPSLATADEHDIDRIDALYEYALEQGYPFYCITVNDSVQQERWKDRTGAEYQFIYSDATVLETIIRANPGLVLLKEGTLYWKMSLRSLDVEQLTSAKLNEQSYGQIVVFDDKKKISWLILLLFGPFALFLLFRKGIYQTNKKKQNEKENCRR